MKQVRQKYANILKQRKLEEENATTASTPAMTDITSSRASNGSSLAEVRRIAEAVSKVKASTAISKRFMEYMGYESQSGSDRTPEMFLKRIGKAVESGLLNATLMSDLKGKYMKKSNDTVQICRDMVN